MHLSHSVAAGRAVVFEDLVQDASPMPAHPSHEATSALAVGIGTQSLVAAVTALAAAALCARAGAPRRVVLAVPLLPLMVNPLGDYFLTPLVNGFCTSHDTHPGSGIPMGAAVAISGAVAAAGALRVGGARPASAL